MNHSTCLTRSPLVLFWVVLCALIGAHPARGQSLLERTPNLSGGWIGAPGQLQFTVTHRFRMTSGDPRVLSVAPTLFLGGRIPGGVFVGANFSSSSSVSPRTPNEFEPLVRIRPIEQGQGAPVDVALQAGYNTAGESVDAELSLARRVGRVRLLGAARLLSSPFVGERARGAIAGGAVVRLGARSAFAGDLAWLLDPEAGSRERVAWSVGLHLQVPVSPHTLSIHAANNPTTTLEGASLGRSRTLYGFEFTVPITLARIFGFRPGSE